MKDGVIVVKGKKDIDLKEHSTFRFCVVVQKVGLMSNSTLRTLQSGLISSEQVLATYQNQQEDAMYDVEVADKEGKIQVQYCLSASNPFDATTELVLFLFFYKWYHLSLIL